MNTFKLIWRSFIQLIKQVCRMPKVFTDIVAQRRQQAVRNELETERLDRIRNPSKYLGK
jgi:hypothetical protein